MKVCPLWLLTWMAWAHSNMADTLGRLELFTCLVKTYTIKQLVGFFVDNPDRAEYAAYSMGITEDDAAKFRAVYTGAPCIKYVCIDVANGYSERFLNYVAKVRGRISQNCYYCW